jgi:hypothetical protein
MSDNPKFIDENGNVWQLFGNWVLVDTSRDRRDSHEMWHGGRGETKRGETMPQGKIQFFDGDHLDEKRVKYRGQRLLERCARVLWIDQHRSFLGRDERRDLGVAMADLAKALGLLDPSPTGKEHDEWLRGLWEATGLPMPNTDA